MNLQEEKWVQLKGKSVPIRKLLRLAWEDLDTCRRWYEHWRIYDSPDRASCFRRWSKLLAKAEERWIELYNLRHFGIAQKRPVKVKEEIPTYEFIPSFLFEEEKLSDGVHEEISTNQVSDLIGEVVSQLVRICYEAEFTETKSHPNGGDGKLKELFLLHNKLHCEGFYFLFDVSRSLFDRGKSAMISSVFSGKLNVRLFPSLGYETDLGFIPSIDSLYNNDARHLFGKMFQRDFLCFVNQVAISHRLLSADMFYACFSFVGRVIDRGKKFEIQGLSYFVVRCVDLVTSCSWIQMVCKLSHEDEYRSKSWFTNFLVLMRVEGSVLCNFNGDVGFLPWQHRIFLCHELLATGHHEAQFALFFTARMGFFLTTSVPYESLAIQEELMKLVVSLRRSFFSCADDILWSFIQALPYAMDVGIGKPFKSSEEYIVLSASTNVFYEEFFIRTVDGYEGNVQQLLVTNCEYPLMPILHSLMLAKNYGDSVRLLVLKHGLIFLFMHSIALVLVKNGVSGDGNSLLGKEPILFTEMYDHRSWSGCTDAEIFWYVDCSMVRLPEIFLTAVEANFLWQLKCGLQSRIFSCQLPQQLEADSSTDDSVGFPDYSIMFSLTFVIQCFRLARMNSFLHCQMSISVPYGSLTLNGEVVQVYRNSTINVFLSWSYNLLTFVCCHPWLCLVSQPWREYLMWKFKSVPTGLWRVINVCWFGMGFTLVQSSVHKMARSLMRGEVRLKEFKYFCLSSIMTVLQSKWRCLQPFKSAPYLLPGYTQVMGIFYLHFTQYLVPYYSQVWSWIRCKNCDVLQILLKRSRYPLTLLPVPTLVSRHFSLFRKCKYLLLFLFSGSTKAARGYSQFEVCGRMRLIQLLLTVPNVPASKFKGFLRWKFRLFTTVFGGVGSTRWISKYFTSFLCLLTNWYDRFIWTAGYYLTTIEDSLLSALQLVVSFRWRCVAKCDTQQNTNRDVVQHCQEISCTSYDGGVLDGLRVSFSSLRTRMFSSSGECRVPLMMGVCPYPVESRCLALVMVVVFRFIMDVIINVRDGVDGVLLVVGLRGEIPSSFISGVCTQKSL